MSTPSFLPAELYLYREDAPHAGGARPLSQGDVFVEIPLLRAAKPHPRHEGQWLPQVKSGPQALGMLTTHPCSSRSRTTHQLKESVSIAPVVRCPPGFGSPWSGYYEFFPLPGLKGGDDYVADLSAVCPVRSELLSGRRIACLGVEGLAALFHRLSLSTTRLDRIPDHFKSEAERVSYEMALWEMWANARGTEEGFQAWLDDEFEGQPLEDEHGQQLADTQEATGTSRRDALRWNYDEITHELKRLLDDS
jgi:MoCo/4Fe-4S cofactor protein with predicted Tat translocation signal